MSTETEKGTDLVYIRNAAGLPTEQWPDERIRTVQKMCAPKAQSVNELAAFLQTCDRYGLDPIQKEAWLAPMNGELSVIVGRDGYLKIAGRDPDYQGFTAAVVREGDEYWVEWKGDGTVDIHHVKKGMDDADILGAYAAIHRKGKKPVFYEARWNELDHLTSRSVWKQHPAQMILTRALTFALKLAYSISGIYSPADIADEGPPGDAGGATLEEINARIRAKTENGTPEPAPEEDEQVVEAEIVGEEDVDKEGPDHEVVEDDAGSVEATQGGTEADASGNGPPAGPDDQEEPDQEEEQVGTRTGKPRSELNRAYFATLSEKAPELYESPAQRKLWQEQKVGKASASDWEADDFELALLLLERGQVEVVTPEATGPESMPV